LNNGNGAVTFTPTVRGRHHCSLTVNGEPLNANYPCEVRQDGEYCLLVSVLFVCGWGEWLLVVVVVVVVFVDDVLAFIISLFSYKFRNCFHLANCSHC
jgi:hypothetical protein